MLRAAKVPAGVFHLITHRPLMLRRRLQMSLVLILLVMLLLIGVGVSSFRLSD